MRILLDECVPRPLRRELAGHDVRTIQEMGWAGKKNGELLALMAGTGFEVLLTVDQNLSHQQDVAVKGSDGCGAGERAAEDLLGSG